MSGVEPIIPYVVDSRASFKRGDRYPDFIYLSAALRMAVFGVWTKKEFDDPVATENIIRKNDSAIKSVGSMIAIGIELGAITGFNENARMRVDGAEKELLVYWLKTMDRENNFYGLAEMDALDYSLVGKQLYQFVAGNTQPVDNEDLRGGLLGRLDQDAPDEWSVHPDSEDVVTTHKLRRNHLDPAIDKAIKLAGNMELADVYLQLKELALAGELPFTGEIDGDALFYTDSDDKPNKLSKDALGKRLKNRAK